MVLLASSFHTQRLKLSHSRLGVDSPLWVGWKRREVGTLQMAQPRGGGGRGEARVRWDLGIGEGCSRGQLSVALRPSPVANPTSPGRAENGLGSAGDLGRPKGEIRGRFIEEEHFLTSKSSHQSPNPQRKIPGEFLPGGRGDCRSPARSSRLRDGRPGTAAWRPGDAAADVEPPRGRELARVQARHCGVGAWSC